MINYLLAFLIGLKHAFEGDHLVTVSTFDKKFKSGFFWGFSHMFSIFFMVLLIQIFKVNIPDGVFTFFEIIVGILLIYFGLSIIFIHKHQHQHSMIKHKHYHSHLFTREHGKTIFTGLIHGLAGSGTLIVLMASLTPNFISSLLFLFLFGTGLILGMSIFSYSLGKIKFIKEDTFKKVIGSISLLYGLYFLTNLF